MTSTVFSRRFLAVAGLGLAALLVSADQADARRGGGFGSRGARTFHAPPPTATAPRQAAPIDRSMSPRTQAAQPQAAQRPANAGQARPGFLGGFGRSMLGGLLVGGLIGMLLGHGFGGMAGFAGMLLQLAIVALVVMLAMRFLRRRQQQPATAAAGAGVARTPSVPEFRRDSFSGPLFGGGAAAGVDAPKARPANSRGPNDEVGILDEDLDRFEALLAEIQSAYAREDFAALRERTTPEILSFLSEELAQNATRGLRNEVAQVTLLQGDLSEAWREDDADYATVAMRYSSVERMLDRDTGRVVEGSDQPTETTEVWTFARERGGDWKLSAIQDI